MAIARCKLGHPRTVSNTRVVHRGGGTYKACRMCDSFLQRMKYHKDDVSAALPAADRVRELPPTSDGIFGFSGVYPGICGKRER